MRLYRNRDFVLFQVGQLLSALGSAFSTIAYPLLVLALTHSPVKAGLVTFARFLPAPLVGLVAGVAADRFDRRRVMLTADAVRAAAIGGLAALVALDPLFWPIPLLAFVEGSGDSFFNACATGALRSMVPQEQLAAAIGVQEGRLATVGLAGPPIGGVLFGIARFVPFAADAASYAASFVSLLSIRRPFQEERERAPTRVRTELADGMRFLWAQPFLRVTSLFFGLGNFSLPGVLFVLVVVARRHGLAAAQIGLLLATFSAALLVGATCSPLMRKRLGVRAIVVLEQYCGLFILAYLVIPNVYLLAAALLPIAFVIPATNSVVIARRMELTPDTLLGRVESVRTTIARSAAPLGPLVAGALLSITSPRETVAFFAAFSVVLALWATVTPALRQ